MQPFILLKDINYYKSKKPYSDKCYDPFTKKLLKVFAMKTFNMFVGFIMVIGKIWTGCWTFALSRLKMKWSLHENIY